MVEVVNSAIQPFFKGGTKRRLGSLLPDSLSEEEKTQIKREFSKMHVQSGFLELESMVKRCGSNEYCFERHLSAADLFLVPQVGHFH